MSSKVLNEAVEETAAELPRRLCSEIRLFDLCELERCTFKDDRYCTDPDMLTRFEAEAEPEDRPVWHFEKDADDGEDEDDGLYSEEHEEDEDEYSVFSDEDRMEQDDDW